jgi:hypothetical protein
MSDGLIDDIPDKVNVLVVVPIDPDSVLDAPENVIGCCMASSTTIIDLVFLFAISNW